MPCYGRGDNLLFFLVGGVIGAGIALLYAPRSGTETRENIKQLATRSKTRVQEEKEAIQQRISDLLNQISSKTEELIKGGTQLAEEKKREILAAIQAAKRAYEEERQKLEESREAT